MIHFGKREALALVIDAEKSPGSRGKIIEPVG
jgi:hypothetical protein